MLPETAPPPPDGGVGVISANDRKLGALGTSNPEADACRSGEAGQHYECRQAGIIQFTHKTLDCRSRMGTLGFSYLRCEVTKRIKIVRPVTKRNIFGSHQPKLKKP